MTRQHGLLAGCIVIALGFVPYAAAQVAPLDPAQQKVKEADELASNDEAASARAAVARYEEAIPLWRAAGRREQEAATLEKISVISLRLGDHKKALEILTQLLALDRSLGDRRGEGVALTNMGTCYLETGQIQTALENLNQALLLLESLSDKAPLADVLAEVGRAHRLLGEGRKAIEYYERSLVIWRATGDKRHEGAMLVNLGAAYDALGEKQRALDAYQQALPLVIAAGDRRTEAYLKMNSAWVYDTLGDKKRALDYDLQALAIFRTLGERRGEVHALNLIGGVHYSLGQTDEAITYHTEALSAARASGLRFEETYALNNLGQDHRQRKDQKKALEFYEQAIPLTRAGGNRQGLAILLTNVGRIHYELRDLAKALELQQEALALVRAAGDRRTEIGVLSDIATIHRDKGDLGQARATIEAALRLTESIRFELSSQQLRATFFSQAHQYYAFHIDVLMRAHFRQPDQALDAVALQTNEQARARSMLEMLVEARADIRKDVDVQLLERERSLQGQLNTLAEQRMKLLANQRTEAQAAALTKELDARTAEFEQLQAQIRTTSPRYASLTQPKPLKVGEIQSLLDPDTLLLEYALGDESSYLWVVSRSSISSFALPKRIDIEQAARRVYSLLTARNLRRTESPEERRARILEADTQFPEAASRLSQMILSPAAALLKSQRLVIVSDGALQYIPFGVLPIGARPLVVAHETVSLPSASVLAVLRQELQGRKPAGKTLAVLADPVFDAQDRRFTGRRLPVPAAPQGPAIDTRLLELIAEPGSGLPRIRRLPYSRQEAERILAMASKGGTLKALDFDASRTTAMSPALGEFRYVHIATHGYLDSERPELSALVLSMLDDKGNAREGFLRAHEVYNLTLPAELVVLSACETGLGKEIRGEGLVGLTRGFMYAGAARVAVSLWSVNDKATAELIEHFYRRMLIEGKRPASALRDAQMEMLSQRAWSAPYYWAGFVLQGEWR